ncbi:MAG: hypothetical protein HN617_17715 [Planctomycetaceae bacterium]|nr:hypothetical protein [Planctomycetaceae bacterium]MBT4845232.1 hypothetical protein [Planctomycetaceae bacterium]MBT5124759.1 hypothetical protein [Planctomycetaceae bacterium]MBT5600385.1 hypothetical protein [Planctomycetaceae bacterium]MBT5883949.1 hypothetical protein [Planctomycetaceae bacterium]
MTEEGAEWVIEGVDSLGQNRDEPTKPNLRRLALRSRKKAWMSTLLRRKYNRSTDWPRAKKSYYHRLRATKR